MIRTSLALAAAATLSLTACGESPRTQEEAAEAAAPQETEFTGDIDAASSEAVADTDAAEAAAGASSGGTPAAPGESSQQ